MVAAASHRILELPERSIGAPSRWQQRLWVALVISFIAHGALFALIVVFKSGSAAPNPAPAHLPSISVKLSRVASPQPQPQPSSAAQSSPEAADGVLEHTALDQAVPKVPADSQRQSMEPAPDTQEELAPVRQPRRLDLSITDAIRDLPAKPLQQQGSLQRPGNGTVFNPALRNRLGAARSTESSNLDATSYMRYGGNTQDTLVHGDTCVNIARSRDHHSRDLWSVPTRCRWIRTESDRMQAAIEAGLAERELPVAD